MLVYGVYDLVLLPPYYTLPRLAVGTIDEHHHRHYSFFVRLWYVWSMVWYGRYHHHNISASLKCDRPALPSIFLVVGATLAWTVIEGRHPPQKPASTILSLALLK